NLVEPVHLAGRAVDRRLHRLDHQGVQLGRVILAQHSRRLDLTHRSAGERHVTHQGAAAGGALLLCVTNHLDGRLAPQRARLSLVRLRVKPATAQRVWVEDSLKDVLADDPHLGLIEPTFVTDVHTELDEVLSPDTPDVPYGIIEAVGRELSRTGGLCLGVLRRSRERVREDIGVVHLYDFVDGLYVVAITARHVQQGRRREALADADVRA